MILRASARMEIVSSSKCILKTGGLGSSRESNNIKLMLFAASLVAYAYRMLPLISCSLNVIRHCHRNIYACPDPHAHINVDKKKKLSLC